MLSGDDIERIIERMVDCGTTVEQLEELITGLRTRKTTNKPIQSLRAYFLGVIGRGVNLRDDVGKHIAEHRKRNQTRADEADIGALRAERREIAEERKAADTQVTQTSAEDNLAAARAKLLADQEEKITRLREAGILDRVCASVIEWAKPFKSIHAQFRLNGLANHRMRYEVCQRAEKALEIAAMLKQKGESP